MLSNWGDPRAGQQPDTFEIGDRAYVKSHVPMYGRSIGRVISVDEYGVSLEFPDKSTMGFDVDDLVNKGKSEETDKK